GCLALAEAFPSARVVGVDRDPEAIARAWSLAHASGLGDRVTFAAADSIRLPRAAFDLAAARAVSSGDDALQVLNDIRNALLPAPPPRPLPTPPPPPPPPPPAPSPRPPPRPASTAWTYPAASPPSTSTSCVGRGAEGAHPSTGALPDRGSCCRTVMEGGAAY